MCNWNQEKYENKNVYVKCWKFKDSPEVSNCISNLKMIKNNKRLKYKPPTFWSWKAQDENVIFFYSLETPPSDLFFVYVLNNYQVIINNENCCKSRM